MAPSFTPFPASRLAGRIRECVKDIRPGYFARLEDRSLEVRKRLPIGEIVFIFGSGRRGTDFVVYTSCDQVTGWTRETGEDQIRLCLRRTLPSEEVWTFLDEFKRTQNALRRVVGSIRDNWWANKALRWGRWEDAVLVPADEPLAYPSQSAPVPTPTDGGVRSCPVHPQSANRVIVPGSSSCRQESARVAGENSTASAPSEPVLGAAPNGNETRSLWDRVVRWIGAGARR